MVEDFLTHRLVACLISIVLVAGFIVSCIGTNMVMLPDMDQGMLLVEMVTRILNV